MKMNAFLCLKQLIARRTNHSPTANEKYFKMQGWSDIPSGKWNLSEASLSRILDTYDCLH